MSSFVRFFFFFNTIFQWLRNLMQKEKGQGRKEMGRYKKNKSKASQQVKGKGLRKADFFKKWHCPTLPSPKIAPHLI